MSSDVLMNRTPKWLFAPAVGHSGASSPFAVREARKAGISQKRSKHSSKRRQMQNNIFEENYRQLGNSELLATNCS